VSSKTTTWINGGHGRRVGVLAIDCGLHIAHHRHERACRGPVATQNGFHALVAGAVFLP
jgi:hypothetical protein